MPHAMEKHALNGYYQLLRLKLQWETRDGTSCLEFTSTCLEALSRHTDRVNDVRFYTSCISMCRNTEDDFRYYEAARTGRLTARFQ
jgi:hypothetical protein